MIKLAKWTYDLGVKHERTRIARELEAAMARQQNENSVIHDMMRDQKLSNRSREKLELKIAVSLRVSEIVNEIFQPHYEDRNMHSTMWPSDMFEEKK